MAKGSKKYGGHEYDLAKGGSGLSKGIAAHKAKAHELREGSRTYPKKMADGGKVSPTPAPVQGSNTNAALSAMGSAVSNPQQAVGGSLWSKLTGKAKGGEIKAKSPEEKAEHKGDSKKDDKIPILASEGEAVLPKSVMKGKNAPKKAEKFVKKIKKEE
jgi:hypothetical protein